MGFEWQNNGTRRQNVRAHEDKYARIVCDGPDKRRRTRRHNTYCEEACAWSPGGQGTYLWNEEGKEKPRRGGDNRVVHPTTGTYSPPRRPPRGPPRRLRAARLSSSARPRSTRLNLSARSINFILTSFCAEGPSCCRIGSRPPPPHRRQRLDHTVYTTHKAIDPLSKRHLKGWAGYCPLAVIVTKNSHTKVRILT